MKILEIVVKSDRKEEIDRIVKDDIKLLEKLERETNFVLELDDETDFMTP